MINILLVTQTTWLPWWLGDKESTCQCRWVESLDQEGFLEKKMATSSSILAWEIPWTEKPGRPIRHYLELHNNNNKCRQDTEHLLYPKDPSNYSFQATFTYLSLILLKPWHLFFFPIVLKLLECYINAIMYYVSFRK